MNIDIEKEILKEMGELKKLDLDADVQVEKIKEVVQETVKEILEQAEEIKKLTAAPIEELKETVEETVEETIKEIKKVTSEDISVIIRAVETTEFPKTFQCCLPFLSKFWEKKKSE